MKAEDFIAALTRGAQSVAKSVGIPASFTVAQAALESGWGTSGLFSLARNNFGVKADKGWTGPTLSMPTHEVVNGKSVPCVALWRSYGTYEECLADHAVFLTGNHRYHDAFQHTEDGEAFAQAVASSGYSTDPAYASKLIHIMRAHNLKALDHPA